MTPAEAGATLVRRLAAEIAADRRALAQRQDELERFSSGAPSSEEAQAAALALVLERAYTCLEALCERVVRTLDGEVPSGGDWHRALLQAACLDVPGVRPAILKASASVADEVRRFRHFVRHAYAAPLDAARVRELAAAWRVASPDLTADLDAFTEFLERLASAAERPDNRPEGGGHSSK